MEVVLISEGMMMNVRDKLEYASAPSTNSQLDEAIDLMRAVVNLQAELLEAFSFVEPPKVEKKERRVEQLRAPSIFTSILTPFSEAKAREFFQKVSNTPVRILVWKVFAVGILISVFSSLIARQGYSLEFGLTLSALGERIANSFLPPTLFQNLPFLRGFFGLLLGTLLFIGQSLAIGLLAGMLISKPEFSEAIKGSKIVLTADFAHLLFLGLFGIPILQFYSYLVKLSPLALSIVILFALISPLVMKFIMLWRGVETMYGKTGSRVTVSMLLLFFLNLIYYTFILG